MNNDEKNKFNDLTPYYDRLADSREFAELSLTRLLKSANLNTHLSGNQFIHNDHRDSPADVFRQLLDS